VHCCVKFLMQQEEEMIQFGTWQGDGGRNRTVSTRETWNTGP